MALTPTGDNVVSASYKTVAMVSDSVLELLMESNTPAGYGILGCALTIGRLLKPTEKQSHQDEIEFVQDLMDWVGAYGSKGELN